MREHGSVRRRRDDVPEAEREPVREPPAAAAMLALQRTAGNRAVVQRLLWNAQSGDLVVPRDYGEERIPWIGGHREDRDPTNADKTLADLAAKDAGFRGQLKEHLGLDYLTTVKLANADAIRRGSAGFVGKAMSTSDVAGDQAVYAKMVHDVAEAAVSHNHVLSVTPGEPLEDLVAVAAARRIVLRPKDFLPEAPDLPGVGVPLLTTEIPNTDHKKYIEYACVLIALFKDNGYATAKQITNKSRLPNDVHKAVQALHDHYVGSGVQYDDGSQRARIMKEWGYSLLWAGLAAWDKLADEVALPQGSYVFDITGHTVKVTVKQDVTPGTAIANPKDFFEPESDPKNYTKNAEWAQKVTAIWKK